MTYYGSCFLVIAKKYAFTMILIPPAEQPSLACAAPSCSPFLHHRLPLWAPAGPLPALLRGCLLWSLAAVLGCAGHDAASLFHTVLKRRVCCPANPSNASEVAITSRGLLILAPGPLFSPLCKTKGEQAAKAVEGVSYDLISPIYNLMILVPGLENSSACGLVLLTSSCRMAAGGSRTGEAKAVWYQRLWLSREWSKVTCEVSHSCDLSETWVRFLP